jgi:hypothetical protein
MADIMCRRAKLENNQFRTWTILLQTEHSTRQVDIAGNTKFKSLKSFSRYYFTSNPW